MVRRSRLPTEPVEVAVESFSHDGRGVAHLGGKAVFLQGALPGEAVRFRYTRVQRRYDEGIVEAVLRPSPDRVEPRCPHFGVCGGCSLQHLDPAAQVRAKERVVADALERIGGVRPGRWLAPLVAEVWGYRRKARLGVKYVAKKGKVLVGFRERSSSFVTDLSGCPILHPQVGERIPALGALVGSLSIRDQVPQIEVAMGDGPCVLLFRVLAPPSAEDRERLAAFGESEGFHSYLQPGGPETVEPLPGQETELSYALPDLGLELGFGPSDFTQVNSGLNRLMVGQALELLGREHYRRASRSKARCAAALAAMATATSAATSRSGAAAVTIAGISASTAAHAATVIRPLHTTRRTPSSTSSGPPFTGRARARALAGATALRGQDPTNTVGRTPSAPGASFGPGIPG